MTMAEKLNQVVGSSGSKPETQEGKDIGKTVGGRSKDNSGGEDDLEKLGQLWAKSWELKGSLGLAKLEKGRVCWTLKIWKRLVVLYPPEIARWKESR
ncbi:hypothetical protein CK203_001357 [Vitis vinifera]|uniref:Uncharacterized protein n=1 Tax=Vitis vinifera TaxID=29760 RepID=A0A438KL35_VITVI|nr:hypothetical protein CK203_001357 [Vitis vinifera]